MKKINKTTELALTWTKEELLEKLKDTYIKQKLPRNLSMIARGIEILIGIIILVSGIEWYYILFYACVVGYSIYRFFHPNEMDDIVYKKLELVAECIDNYKRYKNSEISVEIDDKKINSIEKNINKNLPRLLKNSTFLKVIAFVPIINLRLDEYSVYREASESLNSLLYGNIFLFEGVILFSNENLGINENRHNFDK